MTGTEVLVALAILVGIAGVVIPVLPGSVLILAAILVWAVVISTGTGWAVFAIAATLLVVGGAVKYVVPRHRLRDAGVPTSTLTWGAVAGIVGFFVVPYVGLFIGFVLGVYLAERARVGRLAWASTVHALRAVGLSIVIELVAAVLATMVWTVGVLVT